MVKEFLFSDWSEWVENVTVSKLYNLKPPDVAPSFWYLITRPMMHQPANSTIPQIRKACTIVLRQSASILLAKFVLRMRRKCYFRASGQYSDTTVEFGDTDFLYGTNIFRRSVDIYHVTLNFDPLTLNMSHITMLLRSAVLTRRIFTNFKHGQFIRWLVTFLLLIRYVTLWVWLWP